MINYNLRMGVAAACLFPLFAQAQLSLDDCQRLAEEHYPLVERYDLIGQTADFTLKQIGQGYLPKIAVTGQVSVQNDVPTLPGALERMMTSQGYRVEGLKKDQYRVGVELKQLVWDGGQTTARKQLAQAQKKVDVTKNDVALYALRSRVNELYFGLLSLKEQADLNHEFQLLLEEHRRKLEHLLKGGMVMQADVDAVRAEELELQQQWQSLQSWMASWRKVLALFIGRDENELMVLQRPDVEGHFTQENHRPELQLFAEEKRQAELQTSLLDRARYPKISLFAQTGYGYPGYDFFEGLLHQEWKWTAMAGIRLRWDISSFYNQKNERRKVALKGRGIDNAREVFLFNYRLKATQQRAEMERYRQLLATDDEIIRLRKSVREAAEVRLEKGVIDVVELLEKVTQEKESRLARSRHDIERLKAGYELKFTLNQ